MKILFLLFAATNPLFASSLKAVNAEYDYKGRPEFEAIMAQLAPYGEFSTKKSQVPNETKVLSQGERAVEEAKARNRAIIKGSTSSEVTEDGPAKWRADTKKVQAAWRKEVKDQLKQWQKEQKIFEGKLKAYKENVFVLPVKEEKIIEKEVKAETLPEVHIVNAAFEIGQRGNRTTSLLRENYVRFTVGFSLSDIWFIKRKYD